MNNATLTDTEREHLNLILEDLRYLFSKEEITGEEVDDVLQSLKSEEAKAYIRSLAAGSKPEAALRESFIAGRSVLLRYLFGEAIPEVRIGNGFVDYLVKDEMGRGLILEVKSLFEADVEYDKAGKPILRRLKQKRINPERHGSQILRYVREGEAEFVILTNLKEWLFYSKSLNPREVRYFAEADLHDFIEEYNRIGDIWEYLWRRESESIKYGLDEQFLESLRMWVKKLDEVNFNVDNKRKLELIIELINKFIFIQTLDDYGVIEFNWIKKRWEHHERMWLRKGELNVLEKFFDEMDEWFYSYYDTELFRDKILRYIDTEDRNNVRTFYKNLKLVLGVTYLQEPLGAPRGIMQYNFKYIDEDVLGKAYETFLAEVRKEKGIYYTPKYITRYIAENAISLVFDQLLNEIKRKIDEEDFEYVRQLVNKFTSIKVLDPACGSGSFLIKALNVIVEKYKELSRLIEHAENNFIRKYSKHMHTILPPQEITIKRELISKIKKAVKAGSERELVSRIIVRHLYGVDLDERALEVAKLNIWLQAIRLVPEEFRYDKLPPNVEHILPDLEMNLQHGDSLVGLPDEYAIRYLADRHKEDLVKLFNLRQKYLENPADPRPIEEIKDIIHRIRSGLNDEFKSYLVESKIPIHIINITKPFHWPVEYWHAFFKEDGSPLPGNERGFDIIIGNPPYIEYRAMVRKYGEEYAQFLKREYRCTTGQFDITIPFVERPIKLLKINGILSYIMTNKFMVAEYAYNLREFLLKQQYLIEIIDVSNIKVFKDAAVYPVIFSVKRIDKDLDYTIRIGSPSEEELTSKSLTLSEIPKHVFTLELPLYILTPYITSTYLRIFKKAQSGNRIQEDLFKCGVAQTGFSSRIISSKMIRDAEKENYIQFVQGEDVTPYYIIPPDKYIPLSLLSREKIREFKQRKIMIPGMLKELYCGYDTVGYGCGRVYYITEDSSPYPLPYLVALFNSSLFKFVYRLAYGMSHLSGDYLRVNAPYLRIFSVKIPDAETIDKFKDYVTMIIFYKKIHYDFLKIWNEWSNKLKNGEQSLSEILEKDAEYMREGRFENAWTRKATFYPSGSKVQDNKIFTEFKIRGEIDKNIIKIFGLNEDGDEELVYELELNSRESMLHVYCSLLQTLRSGKKIKTLNDLLGKTAVPIIKDAKRGSGILTPNIIWKTIDELKVRLGEEGIKTEELDIIKVDNEIENLEAEIDALVFKLYGVSEDEIKAVFDFLGKPTIYQAKVFDAYNKL